MPERPLTPTSHLILGLVDTLGPCTVYDMKQLVNISIGMFWSFPHSQLYSEPARLVDDGLLSEHQEQTGRRRRILKLTRAGRKALNEWRQSPTDVKTELRDEGLLQLFFADPADTDAIVALAEARRKFHEDRVSMLKDIQNEVKDKAESTKLRTMELGFLFEKSAARFWADVAKNPPGPE